MNIIVASGVPSDLPSIMACSICRLSLRPAQLHEARLRGTMAALIEGRCNAMTGGPGGQMGLSVSIVQALQVKRACLQRYLQLLALVGSALLGHVLLGALCVPCLHAQPVLLATGFSRSITQARQPSPQLLEL